MSEALPRRQRYAPFNWPLDINLQTFFIERGEAKTNLKRIDPNKVYSTFMASLIIMEQKDHTSVKRNFNVYNISTFF